MLRTQKIKRDYWQHKVSYEYALGMLEALGMWEGDADDYIHAEDEDKIEEGG